MSAEYTGPITPPENALASRYASPAMVANFSDERKVFMERGLWITVMHAQAALGVEGVTNEVISAYEDVQSDINMSSMRARERISGHDVNARIVEFNELAGHQKIHAGMTSRDLTENIEQKQILDGLGIIMDKTAATLSRFSLRAVEYALLVTAGRTHKVPAQTITLGKRWANYGEELQGGYYRLAHLRDGYKLRGIKGPVGTQQDMLDLLDGDPQKVAMLENSVAESLGFAEVLNSVGQIYPRSMDFDVISALKQVTTGPANFANAVREMAAQGLATEGFHPGQVGSSAMPHKMNANKSERIAGLSAVLSGHVTMASEVSSRQWLEGDVSCSAARRVYIPDAFFAADGVFETTIAVLDGFGAYPAVIEQELQTYLPFLLTSKALMAAVKQGVDREVAHTAIKKHAVAVALHMRETGSRENDLLDRLAADPVLRIPKDTLGNAIHQPLQLTGLAPQQIARFVDSTQAIVAQHPGMENYQPAGVL